MKRKQWAAALMTLVLMLTTSLPALAADTPSEEVAAPSEVSHVPLEDAAQTACTAAMAYGAADSISWGSMGRGRDYHIGQPPRTEGCGTGICRSSIWNRVCQQKFLPRRL